jgi:uncharacterized protein YrzB (UPF0473 family)
MPTLNIGKKQFEAKISFKFDRRAEEKYSGDEKSGLSGVEKVYQDLLSYKTSALSAFWDCATAYLKKQQPIVEDIEEAIETVIDEEGTERLFKEAFKALDGSGFFKQQLKEYWSNVNMIDKMADENDKKELKQANLAKETLENKRKALLA